MNAFKRICIFSVITLTACSPLKKPMDVPAEVAPTHVVPKAERKTATEHISSWNISGAMAARNRNKSWSASLNWRQQGPNAYQIRLFGPLGGGTVMIENAHGTITYKDGPKVISSSNADQLLQQQTGIRLPVRNLYYWVRGLPAPGPVGTAKYDSSNRLIFLSQDGYSINYNQYISAGNTELPSKLQLNGHGANIKLVIKNWGIG